MSRGGRKFLMSQEVSFEGMQMMSRFMRLNSCIEITTKRSPFMFLTLDLPPPPLFQDEAEKNIIPQVHNTICLIS